MESERRTGHNDVQILVQLLLGSGLVTREEFARANEMSEFDNVPLLTAVTRTGLLSEDSLKLSVQAQKKVMDNEISSDLAIRAMRIALQRRLSLPDAIESVQRLHQATQVSVSVTNELTTLLLNAKFITTEELGRFIKLSLDSGMMMGHLLMLDNKISTEELLGALNAIVLERERLIAKNNSAQGLRYARQRKISFEHALFELDFLKHPQAKNIRMGELVLLAGLLTREDYAECYEIELFKSKPFGQIISERGLVTAHQVQSANQLMALVVDGRLKPYQAAAGLYRVVKEGVDVDSVSIVPVDAIVDDSVSLVDLIVEAGVSSREVVSRAIPESAATWAEQGAALRNNSSLNQPLVITTLRLKSLVGLGYLPKDKAVYLLNYCMREQTTLEAALVYLNVHVPSRMQWTWVKALETS
ncbi:MAG: hypothetical protein SGJ27_14305 [Candidatus Melainabacteria bacterium]|nr:hypothetical protein [Candidatus Melainabacteria bacterium]